MLVISGGCLTILCRLLDIFLSLFGRFFSIFCRLLLFGLVLLLLILLVLGLSLPLWVPIGIVLFDLLVHLHKGLDNFAEPLID